jgi:hypothetical protein
MLLRHLLCILTSNLSSPTTKLFLPPPKKFSLPMASMVIPSLSSQVVFLPMFGLIVIPLTRRMKLRNFFMNYSKHVLSIPILSPILPLWSWYLRKKVLDTYVLIFEPSTNSQSKKNSSFLSLMTSWMNLVVLSTSPNWIYILATTRST